eukprot:scaffold3424_cov256-Pinguiococcus_pyrenoidosus.AAC.10
MAPFPLYALSRQFPQGLPGGWRIHSPAVGANFDAIWATRRHLDRHDVSDVYRIARDQSTKATLPSLGI